MTEDEARYLDERFGNIEAGLAAVGERLDTIDGRLVGGAETMASLGHAIDLIKTGTCPVHHAMSKQVGHNTTRLVISETKARSIWLTLTVIGSLLASGTALIVTIITLAGVSK